MALFDIRQRALRQAERLTQTDQVRGVVRRDTRQQSRQTGLPMPERVGVPMTLADV